VYCTSLRKITVTDRFFIKTGKERREGGGSSAFKAREGRVRLVVTEVVFVTPLPNITPVVVRSTHSW
jgi:hypothetical protein